MSQMNPKEAFHKTSYSVQLPYIAGHSLLKQNCLACNFAIGFTSQILIEPLKSLKKNWIVKNVHENDGHYKT